MFDICGQLKKKEQLITGFNKYLPVQIKTPEIVVQFKDSDFPSKGIPKTINFEILKNISPREIQ